jgi:alkanesulfonate monooxygenase SsuD/methylene tetrahydromethanopterin reductase-like flavin-dependent oxidoreductase (luciferase family)
VGRGFGISTAVAPQVVREVACEVERLGYSSFWVNDTPAADGLVLLAVAADVTTTIDLGIGVVPLDRRPAPAIVGHVRSLGVPRARLVLGVGSGAPAGGMERVRDAVDVLQHELGARVVVGALGPRMSALAGDVADGALFNWSTPEHAETSARWVLDAARAAGRPPPSLLAYVRCGLLPGARGRLAEELAHYDGLAHFDRHVQRMGVAAADTCVLATEAAALQDGIARYETRVDETIVRAVTPDDGAQHLLALAHACAPRGPVAR